MQQYTLVFICVMLNARKSYPNGLGHVSMKRKLDKNSLSCGADRGENIYAGFSGARLKLFRTLSRRVLLYFQRLDDRNSHLRNAYEEVVLTNVQGNNNL